MIYNKIMFSTLERLLTFPHTRLQPAQEGRILDILRTLTYFHNLNNAFGADYLLLLLPYLEPMTLRQGFALLEDNNNYVLMEGKLDQEQQQYSAVKPVDIGICLQMRKGIRFMASNDCKLIKIRRGMAIGYHAERKIAQQQRERKRFAVELHQKIQHSQMSKLQLMKSISFFSQLGQYDFLELVTRCQLEQYSLNDELSKVGVIKVGRVISGKVKRVFSASDTRGQPISMVLIEGDWIGLDQCLSPASFPSSFTVGSIAAIVLWVPRADFEKKYSVRVNHDLRGRLKDLADSKRGVLEKSISSRRKKQAELNEEEERIGINSKLLNKISALHNHSNSKPRHSRRRSKYTQEFQIPQQIMHRLNFNSPSALPKLAEKPFNLFPQEYKAAPISGNDYRELKRLEKLQRKQQSDTSAANLTQRNHESLYQTILERMPKRWPKSPSQTITYRRVKEEKPQKSLLHYNNSIYNNFRAPRQKQRSSSFSKIKTIRLPQKFQ